MSALSAIETPVVEAREPRGAVTAEFGCPERPLRAVAGQPQSIAGQDRETAIGDGQPRSSSILAAGSAPSAGLPSGPGRASVGRHAVDAAAANPAPVLAGVIVGSPRPRVRPMAGTPRTRLRLTRRGRVVVATLVITGVTLVALLITLVASGGAQATNHGQARAGYQGMHKIVVQPGQTLWSIASAAEPSADPRTVVQEIMSANALAGPTVIAGQLLWVPR